MGKKINAKVREKWAEMTRILLTTGLVQEQLASESGVSQSAVSRLQRYPPNRDGPAFRKLCIYANKVAAKMATRKGVRPLDNEELASAIRDVWNGTPEHARALAAMIRAVGAACTVAAN